MADEGTGAPPARRARLDAVDALRGIVMILMALDHTRDFFGDLAASPTDLATTSAPLFLTRWITHFCAPVFFLLTGAGAYLSGRRRSPAWLSRFLLTRGLWLVLLELTVVRFLWQFNLDYRLTLLNVLWALGWSMVVLAALVRLPLALTTAFGVALVALHHLPTRCRRRRSAPSRRCGRCCTSPASSSCRRGSRSSSPTRWSRGSG
jgi:uncharacterized membrane protein